MKEKILIVENEKPWKELLGSLLSSYYDLHIVDSREQVTEKLLNEDIRLAIVNINLLEDNKNQEIFKISGITGIDMRKFKLNNLFGSSKAIRKVIDLDKKNQVKELLLEFLFHLKALLSSTT